jgi:hypothetical protein
MWRDQPTAADYANSAAQDALRQNRTIMERLDELERRVKQLEPPGPLPLAECDRCGRPGWEPFEPGEACGMPQYDGNICGGSMRASS